MAKKKICLDAGHYGAYNPSPVVKGYFEGKVMWQLHLLLKEQLEKRGFEVIITRDKQSQDLALEERGRMAKGCVGFVSLHSNAADSKKPNWAVAMHFVDDNCGKIDDQSLQLAKLLGQTVGDVMGVGHEIYTRTSSKDRDGNGKKDDYYGVLRGAHSVGVPGVIIEHGFHTNPENTRWLMVTDNLRRLAEAEAEALAAFFGARKTVSLDLLVLKKGAKGEDVRAMQQLLIGNGYPIVADGSFGGKTENALLCYQEDAGLEPDGSCGRKTWSALLGV